MDTYQLLNTALQHSGALYNAAEIQGLLCGLSCATEFDEQLWVKQIFGDQVQSPEPEQVFSLLQLKETTLTQLNSMDCDFDLLLPDEDTCLANRAQTLGKWCDAFLLGLGLAQVDFSDSALGQEFVKDLTAISRISTDEPEDEEGEFHYMQLVEYIKIGILNLREELVITT